MADKQQNGAIVTFVNLGTDFAEKVTGSSFGLARDVRGAGFDFVTGTIDWVEGTQKASTQLVRRTVERVDRIVQDSIDAGEKLSLNVVRLARDTGKDAGTVVAKARAVVAKRVEKKTDESKSAVVTETKVAA